MRKIGEQFKVKNLRFKVIPEINFCNGCFFENPDGDDCKREEFALSNNLDDDDFQCTLDVREDDTDVIYILTNFKFGK